MNNFEKATIEQIHELLPDENCTQKEFNNYMQAINKLTAEWQVKTCNKPDVSGSFCNCESLEKELHYGYGLPVCFKCNKVVKLQNDH